MLRLRSKGTSLCSPQTSRPPTGGGCSACWAGRGPWAAWRLSTPRARGRPRPCPRWTLGGIPSSFARWQTSSPQALPWRPPCKGRTAACGGPSRSCRRSTPFSGSQRRDPGSWTASTSCCGARWMQRATARGSTCLLGQWNQLWRGAPSRSNWERRAAPRPTPTRRIRCDTRANPNPRPLAALERGQGSQSPGSCPREILAATSAAWSTFSATFAPGTLRGEPRPSRARRTSLA
mmetsp:Transcript_2123/g.7068  ORF Transcript_2123/g.7068 Transcript_2123/m.7068 type:complete len:234 (+) Transcript_2123:1701-2402(+)